jgi:two-component system sensor histidine kinase UhpB
MPKSLNTQDYELIIGRVSDGFVAFDQEFNYIFVNESACAYLKKTKDELIGKNLFDVFPESKNLPFIQTYKEAMKSGESMQWEEYLPPYKRWYFNVIYPSEKGLSVFFKDITTRKLRENDIEIANERFELAALATDDVVWDWDLKTNNIWWNKRFKEIFQYRDEEIESDISSWENRIHPDDLKRTVDGIYDCIRSGKKFWSDEYRFKKRDGDYAFLFDRGYIVYDDTNTPVRMIGAMMDITARKKSEIALSRLNKQLQMVSMKLQNVVEEERTRIAHEIHDELGQQLTLIKIDIASTKSMLGEIDPIAKEKFDSVLSSVNEVIRSLQRIATDLRPKMLDDLGLTATLEWYSSDFEKRTGIKTGIECAFDDAKINRSLAIAIFRIVQEAFTNIARHSQARRVLVEAIELHDVLTVKITDNGIGFHVKDKRIRTSLGLAGMQERARLINSELRITSLPNIGTRIKVIIPLSNQKNDSK